MSTTLVYKTRQREDLIHYLSSVQGTHITAADVCDHLKEQGIKIGQSTVYRQLERLVDEGVLSKYIIDANSPACFEYIGEEHIGSGDPCYHLKCEKCGRLIHLHCEEMQEFMGHLYAEHGFQLDPRRTVLYGLCEDCSPAPHTERKD